MWTITFLFFVIHIFLSNSQFYGGTISWRIPNPTNENGTLTIVITQTYIWSYSTMACDNTAITGHSPITASQGTLICVSSCPTDFGSVSTEVDCVDGSIFHNISVGQSSTEVTLQENSMFSIMYQGSPWSGLSISSNWSMLSYINLVEKSNNTFNNAPIATVISPIYIQENKPTAIPISVYDPDGDIVRCRLATQSSSGDECGTVCSTSISLSSNCTVEITGTVVNSVYPITVMAEDFINSASITPLSSVPVQFLVIVIGSVNCTPPEITLADSLCTALEVGSSYTDRLFGVTNCEPNVTIIDIVTLSFTGMVTSPLYKVSSTTYYKSMTWTPTAADIGLHVMCAMALDSNHLQSSQLCFTFGVALSGTDNPCSKLPTDNTTTTTTMPTSESIGTQLSSSCISWPLFACLAALLAMLMLCNSCLLCHLYRICGYCYRRRSYKEREVHTPSTITLVPINRLFPPENNNVGSRPIVQRISIKAKTKKF